MRLMSAACIIDERGMHSSRRPQVKRPFAATNPVTADGCPTTTSRCPILRFFWRRVGYRDHHGGRSVRLQPHENPPAHFSRNQVCGEAAIKLRAIAILRDLASVAVGPDPEEWHRT